MVVFKSKNIVDNTIYDEEYYINLSRKLAEDSIKNLRKDIKSVSDD